MRCWWVPATATTPPGERGLGAGLGVWCLGGGGAGEGAGAGAGLGMGGAGQGAAGLLGRMKLANKLRC